MDQSIVKKPSWTINSKHQDKFIKKSGLADWESLKAKVSDILSFLVLTDEFILEKMPKQFIFFDQKFKDDSIKTYSFEAFTELCKKCEDDFILLDVGTYHLDELMDHFNAIEEKERRYFTKWGMVLNFYVLEA